MDNLVPLFIICTAIAVIIQMGILVLLFVTVRKTTSRLEKIATEVSAKALPMIDTAQSILVDIKPRVTDIMANTEQAVRTARSQMERLDATVNDIVDRTRLQVIRADELVSRGNHRDGASHRRVSRAPTVGAGPGSQCRIGIFPGPQAPPAT